METMNSTIPKTTLANHRPCPLLQRRIGMRYALLHRIVVLGETMDRIELAIEEASPVMMDEIRKMMPRGKAVVFYRVDPHEIEAAMKKLYDPFGLSRYC
jgi:hypothetical protein